jgi:hypothetical protein
MANPERDGVGPATGGSEGGLMKNAQYSTSLSFARFYFGPLEKLCALLFSC